MGATAHLRPAVASDAAAISELMRDSIRALFPRYYDERQTASGVRYIAEVDRMLIEDGTYYVLESGGELVGCGGWSRRDKLYTGSGASDGDARLLDPATEPARVRAMFVRGDWTRRGLGRRILEESRRRQSARASGSSPCSRRGPACRSTSPTASSRTRRSTWPCPTAS